MLLEICFSSVRTLVHPGCSWLNILKAWYMCVCGGGVGFHLALDSGWSQHKALKESDHTEGHCRKNVGREGFVPR